MKTEAIFGPPGTGKTRSLIERTHAHKHQNVLYLSFTKAAALEAASRTGAFVRPSTIHSLTFNALGMSRASVVDKGKLAEFGKASGIPFMGSERGSDELQEGDEYLAVLEYANNRIIPPSAAWEQFGCPGTKTRFDNFCLSYLDWKKMYGFMDFDDMLKTFTEDDRAKPPRADVVFLDEAQDCSPQQWLAFLKVVKDAKKVYIAGDDDQAIYEWSGADPHGMINFAEETDGVVQVLNQSFRVPQAPLHIAIESCLSKLTKRVPKEFRPAPAMGSVDFYGSMLNIDFDKLNDGKSTMILLRDRFLVEEVKKELNRQMIPYDVLGGYSPWTGKYAAALKRKEKIDIPIFWRDFYEQADLTLPINITVSTIHQAKGREAERVVLDLTLRGKPLLAMALDRDPELRVLYVALTRTLDELILCGESPLL